MGLFDFVANIGKKIFSSEAEAADKIKGYFEGDNPGVNDFQVTVKDGVATISGAAASPDRVFSRARLNLAALSPKTLDTLPGPRMLTPEEIEWLRAERFRIASRLAA